MTRRRAQLPRGRFSLASAATVVVVGAAGCDSSPSSATDVSPPAAPVATASAARVSGSAETNQKGVSDADAVRLIREHLEAVDNGDADAWAQALAPDVRFDIAGSIYQGRDEARGWGERDPIGQGGRYDILSLTPDATGVTADVTFRAGSLVEQIRYVYTVRDGSIVDLLARYRR